MSMHKLIAHGSIESEGKLLVIKRSETKRGQPNYYPLFWDIPGGSVEENETPRTAVIREVKEEVGLEVTIEKVIHEDSNLDINKATVFTRLVYQCKLTNAVSEIKNICLDPEEHTAYKWIDSLEELTSEQVVPYLVEIIENKIKK